TALVDLPKQHRRWNPRRPSRLYASQDVLDVWPELRRTRLSRAVAPGSPWVLQIPPHRHSRQAGLARNRTNAPALAPQHSNLHCLLLSQHGRFQNRHPRPGGPLLLRRVGHITVGGDTSALPPPSPLCAATTSSACRTSRPC